MFKILKFFGAKSTEAKIVSQRERFEAVCEELNAVLSELNDMPVIQIDAQARQIVITPPDQFADKALALPKPTDDEADKATDQEAARSEPTTPEAETAVEANAPDKSEKAAA